MLRLEQQLSQKQVQTLTLSQQQILGLHMLQMNALELEQFLAQQVEQNPLLELERPEPAPIETTEAEAQVDDDPDSPEYGQMLEETPFTPAWNGPDFSFDPDLGKVWDYRYNSVTQETSLHSHLMAQLRAQVSDADLLTLCEFLVMQLDDNGYLSHPLEELAEESGIPRDSLDRALEIIRGLEPAGVGTTSIQECLVLQARRLYPGDTLLETVLANHFTALCKLQFRSIAQDLNISENEVEEVFRKVKTLDPWPGREFQPSPPPIVTPEVIIQEIPEGCRVPGDPKYEAVPASDSVFKIRLNDAYIDEVRQSTRGELDDNTKKFLKEKRRAALELLHNLSRREQTLTRVAGVIAETQEEFFDTGDPARLKPLRLRDVAEKLGIHEATVSRTVKEKYAQTPQGIYELRWFFGGGLVTDTGEEQSARAIQQRIRELVDQEDPLHPLSDQAIAEMLKKEGVNIARRTVTKYREQMGILSSSTRRRS